MPDCSLPELNTRGGRQITVGICREGCFVSAGSPRNTLPCFPVHQPICLDSPSRSLIVSRAVGPPLLPAGSVCDNSIT